MISTKRSNIQDDNNYIEKFGKITHVCPECGNLYSYPLRLRVDCIMDCDSKEELESYTIETVNINRKCSCGTKAIQVDNALGKIVQQLVRKGYKFISGCEGHIYIKQGTTGFDFPELTIAGNIISYVPACYNKYFEFEYSNGKTKISCGNIDANLICLCSNKLETYKSHTLIQLENLVGSLPDLKNTNTYCECTDCDNQCSCR